MGRWLHREQIGKHHRFRENNIASNKQRFSHSHVSLQNVAVIFGHSYLDKIINHATLMNDVSGAFLQDRYLSYFIWQGTTFMADKKMMARLQNGAVMKVSQFYRVRTKHLNGQTQYYQNGENRSTDQSLCSSFSSVRCAREIGKWRRASCSSEGWRQIRTGTAKVPVITVSLRQSEYISNRCFHNTDNFGRHDRVLSLNSTMYFILPQ